MTIENTSNGTNAAPITSTTTSNNNNNNIKITKVVSSRSQFPNGGCTGANAGETTTTPNTTPNLVYYNKINNQLIPISQPPGVKQMNGTFINRTPFSSNIPGAELSPGNTNVTTIPKFYTTSKMFTTHYVNQGNANLKFATTLPASAPSASASTNSHLSTLNSNLTRYASQPNSQTPNTVTINPRYLVNINNSSNSSVNSLNVNGQVNSNVAHNINANNSYISNNVYFHNQHVEPDEEVVVEEEEELGHAETYASYMPTKCKFSFLSMKPFCAVFNLIFWRTL